MLNAFSAKPFGRILGQIRPIGVSVFTGLLFFGIWQGSYNERFYFQIFYEVLEVMVVYNLIPAALLWFNRNELGLKKIAMKGGIHIVLLSSNMAKAFCGCREREE